MPAWSAYGRRCLLARRGHAVTLHERSAEPFTEACSPYAGAMLAPRCEEESAEAVIGELGRRGIALWQEAYPGTKTNGTLVVALHRDRAELDRFARMTGGHRRLSPAELAEAEPALSDRFAGALFYAEEAHLAPDAALRFLLDAAIAAGVDVRLGDGEMPQRRRSRHRLPGPRRQGRSPHFARRARRADRHQELARSIWRGPVRLLHPRFPLYVVPWGDGVYMIGATVIESEEIGAITLRSALDLLSAAYALDPAFAEAEIVRQGAGARPAFPDNRPRIIPRNGYIYVNGLYRHGFLLAPVLAELVAAYIETGATHPEVFLEHPAQR